MKIRYQREMKHNYLIMDPEELQWHGYELQMLAENSIEGVLHFQIRQKEDGVEFYYEITSRQPLSRLLENRSIQAEEIRKLITGIFRVLEQMESYLLREGMVYLSPEFIYIHPDTYRVWLCLVPGLQTDFPKEFGNLLECLLSSVDHQDPESVVLAYGLFQESRKENYGMNDVRKLLYRENGSREKREVQKDLERRKGEEYEEKAVGQIEFRKKNEVKYAAGSEMRTGSGIGTPLFLLEEEHDRKEKLDCKSKYNCDKKQKIFWFLQWKDWIRQKFFQKEKLMEKQPEKLPSQRSWELLFQEEVLESEESDFGKSFEDQQASMETGTVLLADLSQKPDSRQRVLRATNHELEDILIPYCPFIIGKQGNLVDYKLERDTVSRLHLRIDQKDARYWVQDLNSTNGTMVGDRLLENNEAAELHIGDVLCIAGYSYRFE